MKSLSVLVLLLSTATSLSITHAAPLGAAKKENIRVDAYLTLEEAFVQNVREQLSISMEVPSKDFKVVIENFKLQPSAVEVKRVKNVQVLGLGTKRIDGLFSLPIVVQTDSIAQEFQATGVLKITGPVYVAKKSLLRAEVINKEDLNLVQLPWNILPTGAAGSAARQLIGQRVRAHIESGDPVYPALLDEPFAVKNGDLVELTLMAGPGVMIRSRAVAKQEGRLGDTIRLEQPDTKKAISGQITGSKSVEVRL